MQHGGVDVGDVVGVLDGVEAQLVGRAVDGPRLDARAGEPDGEAVGVVVAAGGLASWPSRTSRPGVRPNSVQQTTVTSSVSPRRFRSLSRPATGLSTRAHDGRGGLELGVRVPLAVVAEVDQHEPHAALGQPPGGEQAAAVDRVVSWSMP